MDSMRELSHGEMSALCSNLAKACEKQQLFKEQELFTVLADYYIVHAEPVSGKNLADIKAIAEGELESGIGEAVEAAQEAHDRGALRVLTWSQKVTNLLGSLFIRYEKQGDALLEGTGVYVCEICGFVFIGNTPPPICPICKVPNRKLQKVG